jgi:hypothetical protein
MRAHYPRTPHLPWSPGVSADALTAQLHRFAPPYPGEAHRTWYIGPDGTVDDRDDTDGLLPAGEA